MGLQSKDGKPLLEKVQTGGKELYWRCYRRIFRMISRFLREPCYRINKKIR